MKIVKNIFIFIFIMGLFYAIGLMIPEQEGPGFEWPKCVEGTYAGADHICREPGEINEP